MSDCEYQISENERCPHPKVGGHPSCVFHSAGKFHSAGTFEDAFWTEFDKLHLANDGDWRHFMFPPGFCLKNFDIEYPVRLNFAQLPHLIFEKGRFQQNVDLSDVYSETHLNMSDVRFCEACTFDRAILHDLTLDSVRIRGRLSAHHLVCKGDFRFRGSASSGASFNNAQFHGAAQFRGVRTIVGKGALIVGGGSNPNPSPSIDKTSKKPKNEPGENIEACLNGNIQFQEIEFYDPPRTIIHIADFQRAHVIGTNFEGVTLLDITWPEGRGGLRKIYDDIWCRTQDDLQFQEHMRHRIETAYRNLRRAHEIQKDYATANDFYVGEMETRRDGFGPLRKNLFSLNTIYCYLSKYGTGPGRATLVFLLLSLIYAIVSMLLAPPPEEALRELGLGNWKGGSVPDLLQAFLGIWADGVQIMILKEPTNAFKLGGSYMFLDSIARILGPIQVAMIAISFRNMIKRG